MENILILGAAGFIGTNLTIELAKNKDNRIILVDRHLEYFAPIKAFGFENIEYRQSDLTVDIDFEEVLNGADTVYHLVSTTVPSTSNQQISQELTGNVIFSANMLDACIRCGVKKVVFMSSGGTVYGKEVDCPLKEKTATNPISSYGIQKITIEKLLYLYRYLYGLDYRIIRLANPYGPYQRPNGVLGAVTTFTYKALKGEEITVYGDGSVVRDFIYIDDAVRAIMKIVYGENKHHTFNLGCGYGTSIKDVLATIQDALQVELRVTYRPGRKVDVPVNYLDISRYEKYYGALNPISLSEGVLRTANFIRNEYFRKADGNSKIAGSSCKSAESNSMAVVSQDSTLKNMTGRQGRPMERIAVIMGKMHSGGKKNLVMEYYRHIDRSKFQFDFICDSDSNAIPKEEIEALGGRYYEIAPYKSIFKNMSQMRSICKQNNYKIMHGYNGTMNVFAMLVGKWCGIPIRINESISMGHSADKKTILKNILKPFTGLGTTHYMANGEICGRWQFGDKAFDDGKVAVFKTVIDTKKHDFDLKLRNKTRLELGLTDNIVIGHIGRLTEQKNTLFIIDIFNEILKTEPNAMLLLIGDGNLRETMLARIDEYGIKDSVLYLGRREDIDQFYNAMDCFLLPSLYEGLPVVGVEAETCGLPMFFSTEIPIESSACDDLGHFIGLDKSAMEWAEQVLKATKENMGVRRGHVKEVKEAGFDSEAEGKRLGEYYYKLINTLTGGGIAMS